MDLKFCSKCNEETKRHKSGRCAKCAYASYKRYYDNNKRKVHDKRNAYRAENKELFLEREAAYRAKPEAREKNRQYCSAYYYENRERILAEQKEAHRLNPDKAREHNLRRKYGIGLEEYKALLEGQGGVCKICKSPPPDTRLLAVDHCHQTGRIRGILCSDCNTAIGLLRDSPGLLAAAMDYLKPE